MGRSISLPKIALPRPRTTSRRTLVGLDIEPGAIHAAQVGVNGHLEIEKGASAPLGAGVIRDGEVQDAEALATALHDLFAEHDLDRRVRIGVANQRIVVRTLELPPISDPKELAAAIRFQAPEQVPMPLDQAVLDHVVLGMAETPAGPRMRVLLVAARRDMIERLLSTARSAGLKPEGIDLAAFAMVRALPRSEDTVLQLAVGGVVNMAVARRGQCLFTRVVGGGLEAMAVELAERSSITLEEARESVITDGVTGEGETQVVVADGIRRIAGEVRNSIDFHLGVASTDGDTAVARVLLTGMAAPVPGFAEALSERLSLPVETAAPITRDAAAAHRFTVAAGLAVEEAPGA